MSNLGKLVAIAAPSGAGKSTICKALLKAHPKLLLSISATSRPPRGTEKNGTDYFFYSKAEFEQKIKNGDFIEYEKVHDNYYGTLKAQVMESINNGKSVLFDIDVNGALALKKLYPEAILIFIKAPNMDILLKRLKARKTETEEQIQMRLKRTSYELEMSEKFDFIVINDILDRAIEKIEALIFTPGASND